MEKDTPIELEKTYNVLAEKVWQAITDKDQMRQWYFDLEDFKPEEGFEFSFAGQGHKGEKYIHHCEVVEAVAFRKLKYSWKYEGYKGMSYVVFELFPEGAKTKLKLTHEGVSSFPDSPDFARSSFLKGWSELIGTSLKNFLEK